MAQHIICRSLSSGRGGGGGRQKLPGGGISYAMGGAAAPPYAGSGAVPLVYTHPHTMALLNFVIKTRGHGVIL